MDEDIECHQRVLQTAGLGALPAVDLQDYIRLNHHPRDTARAVVLTNAAAAKAVRRLIDISAP